MLLIEDEYRRSTAKKQTDSHDGDEQFSDQPGDVRDKVATIKKDGPTKDMLMERAQDPDINGRSSMTKEELLDAIEAATDENGRGKGTAAGLANRKKSELYEKAQEAGIGGRSTMSKRELIDALEDRV